MASTFTGVVCPYGAAPPTEINGFFVVVNGQHEEAAARALGYFPQPMQTKDEQHVTVVGLSGIHKPLFVNHGEASYARQLINLIIRLREKAPRNHR